MSGLELLEHLLHITGAVEQGIILLQSFQNQNDHNVDTLRNLRQMFAQIHEQLQQLQIQMNKLPLHLSSQQGFEMFNNTMSCVNHDIENVHQFLKDMKNNADTGKEHISRENTITSNYNHLQQLMNSTKNSLLRLSNSCTAGGDATLVSEDKSEKLVPNISSLENRTSRITVQDKSQLNTDVDNSHNIAEIFANNIQTLEINKNQSSESDIVHFKPDDIKRMHRSLCVSEQQRWIPISVLAKLWELTETIAKCVCEELVRVGLVDWHHEMTEHGTVIGITIPKFSHNYATEDAERNEKVSKWHAKLVTQYSKEAGRNEDTSCYSWWNLRKADHGYAMKNLFRHIHSCGLHETQMINVVSRPEWIACQLSENGILQYQEDVALAMVQKRNEGSISIGSEINNESIQLILQAANLSASFVRNNPDEVWFQIYCRLMSLKKSHCIQEYLRGIEDDAPRPRLKPLSYCLTAVQSRTEHIIDVNKGIFCMAVLSGRHDVICGCQNGYIVLVDIEESRVKRKWKAHERNVSAISLSSHGRFIVTGSEDSTLKLWDCETWQQMGTTLSAGNDGISSVAISTDERTLYTASNDGNVRSWDLDTFEEKRVILCTSAGSTIRIGVMANDNLVIEHLWNGGTFEILQLTEDSQEPKERPKASSLSSGERMGSVINEAIGGLSGDGTMLITAQSFTNFEIWSGMNMNKLGDLKGPRSWMNHVAVDSGGYCIAIARSHGTVTVYEANHGDDKEMYQIIDMYQLETSIGDVTGLQFIDVTGKKKMVSCTRTGIVRVTGLRNQNILEERHLSCMSRVQTMVHTPEGKYFVAGHEDGEISFWETSKGTQSGSSITVHKNEVRNIGVSEDGQWIVSISCDHVIAVSNVQKRTIRNKFQIETIQDVTGLDVNCSGTRFVLQYGNGAIHVWDSSRTDEPILIIPQNKRTKTTRFQDVWFRTATDTVVSMCDGWIEEWDISSESLINTLEFNWSSIHSLREEAFNLLTHFEDENVMKLEQSDNLEVYWNGISYDGDVTSHKLGTLESYIEDYCFSPKSNALCVVLASDEIHFFRVCS